ncbi:unnamed protein product [Penicillium salamii]|uniref:F-actin-capping protein subunit alpha n=1 Tax=Penicillium salamii TaxID=1612424 RepID=A0A9W4ILY3_9EURO|nr:unnamed protein product [Penicillium salamii]
MAELRPSAPGRSVSAHAFESKLSQQLSQPHSPDLEQSESSRSPRSPKSRSLSDASKPTSSTQPATGDLSRPPSKDENAIPALPATPRRSSLPYSSLSLNLPSKPAVSPSLTNRAPLSPKLDPSHTYGSPGSVLPRRSRGLDFSRACTNLHHSTLAESSPDSSPTVGGRGMAIPQRHGSPGATSNAPFSTSGPVERTAISSSMSSVNMMESDTSSSDDEDETMGDRDDMMLNTPQATRMHAPSPFAGPMQSPGNEWMGGYSQAAASLMSFQRARFRKGRSRHSSSSASGNSSKPSPTPHSPPIMKSVEHSSGGYFAPRPNVNARRESISFSTRDLRLSDMSDDGESRNTRSGSPIPKQNSESGGGPWGVIRRAVTRRGSLLPKTKTFARIRAALMEEGAPVDSDMKREAEVVRQVRDTEPEPTPALGEFPSLQPSTSYDSTQTDETAAKSGMETPSKDSFNKQASRNSGGVEFWNSFDGRYRTPPPARQGGPPSVADDDISMDMTPSTTIGSVTADSSKPRSRSCTPHAPGMTSIGEICRKRRRDDDFDPNLFKRRAVSPSVSAQSSPVMTHSHHVNDTGPNIWGPPPKPGLGAPFSERSSADSGPRTTPHGGTKRICIPRAYRSPPPRASRRNAPSFSQVSRDFQLRSLLFVEFSPVFTMASTVELASSFIEGAPPGELADVVSDVQALTSEGDDIISTLQPAFKRYNETQLATVKLPGSSQEVIVSEFNVLEENRYFDPESQASFEFDHTTQTASGAQSYHLESENADLIKSLLKSFGAHAREHYPSCSYGVYPIENDSAVAIILVANRYSPNNFWNGRFRAFYQVPVSSPSTLTGKIHVDVHYYEDGNVALNTTKPLSINIPSVSAESIVSKIAAAERDYQEALNRAFVQTAEGSFKGLRRQLPITRQKVEWEKVGGYRLGQDISGGKGR